MLVDGAAVVVEHRQPRGADRGVGLPVAPGPAHRVGDDDGDLDAEQLAQPRPQSCRAGIGIGWQQGQFAAVDVRAVHPGGGLDQAVGVLGDQRAALAGQHPHRLLVDQLAPQRIPLLGVGRRGDDAALALGHDLAGDDNDVGIGQPGRCGRQRRPPGRRPAETPAARPPAAPAVRRRCRAQRRSRRQPGQVQPGAHHLRGGRRIGHQKRYRAHLHAGHLGAVALADQPAASSSPVPERAP